ncbi:hypothetical protein EJ06DRAFT_401604 [Trichodelitschia bisporula]|uniref:Uncharacterized protein n=1 Tax=Trichodelitschia bisporula TaxID=703511 RepID=A0A6G1HXI9_9PEZI|nr:hypothetical protein EJ06DRAFT_401604 [Trichodelitschia bisporula]
MQSPSFSGYRNRKTKQQHAPENHRIISLTTRKNERMHPAKPAPTVTTLHYPYPRDPNPHTSESREDTQTPNKRGPVFPVFPPNPQPVRHRHRRPQPYPPAVSSRQ